MNFKIPFSGRAHFYSKDEIQTVVEVMQSAKTLTQGQYLENFQNKFCQFTGSKYAFAVNNATSALELTAQMCQFNNNDEVIIPSHTYTATAYPFLKNNAKIVWADIDQETRVVTAQSIEQCISKNTKVIVVVHLYGYCADMPAIMKLADKYKLLVVEDAAQALGARLNNQMAGTFGDFGVFSFHSHKNLSTLGEGGMLAVNKKEYADIIPKIRHNGHSDFSYDREYYWIPAMGNVDLPELYDQPLLPNNFCIGEAECALGTILLDRIDKINKEKRNRAIFFIDTMKDFSDLIFHKENSTRHNYHLLVAQFTNGKRDKFITKASELGIQCVVQYYPLNRYDLYKKLGYGKADCPNSDNLFDNMVSFPFQHMMNDNDFNFMVDCTKKILSKL